MAKRAKTAGEDKDFVLQLNEKVDLPLLQSISELWLSPEVNASVLSFYKAAKKGRGWVLSKYYNKHGGRATASCSLQSMKKWIVRIISGGFYTEIDICNCAPTCCLWLFEGLFDGDRQKLKSLSTLRGYVVDRAGMFERVRLQTSALSDAPNSLLKTAFLKVMHGGDYFQMFADAGFPLLGEVCPVLDRLKDDFCVWAAALREEEDCDEISEGSLVSLAWQQVEFKLSKCLIEFLHQEGYKCGVWKYDGVLVEHTGTARFSQDVLLRAAAHISEEVGVPDVRLSEKSLRPTDADWDLYYGPKNLGAVVSDLDKVIHLCVFDAHKCGYQRMDDSVYSRHPGMPCVWTKLMPLPEYLNKVVTASQLQVTCFNKALEWLTHSDHPRFRIMKASNFDNTCIAFSNGWFNIESCLFTEWDEDAPDFITRHFLAHEVDTDALAMVDSSLTPLWSQLLDYQLSVPTSMPDEPDLSNVYLFEAMIGRLFFPIGAKDNWQVAPFIIGDANTGKSTVVTIVQHMFPVEDVGTIGSSLEDRFGLENFLGKRVILCPDMPVNMHKILDAANLQSMVTGESMMIPRKNKKAIQGVLSAPSLWSGNRAFAYTDRNGSIWRRFPMFPFRNLVKKRDTTMLSRILKDELCYILIRCIMRYHAHIETVGSDDFWAHVPRLIAAGQDELRNATDDLSNFISNGSSYYQIVRSPGKETSVADLGKAFSNYMQFERKKRGVVMGTDMFPVKAAGFTVAFRWICKICGGHHTKASCGLHYDRNNRVRLKYVVDMEIVTQNKASFPTFDN